MFSAAVRSVGRTPSTAMVFVGEMSVMGQASRWKPLLDPVWIPNLFLARFDPSELRIHPGNGPEVRL
jgi:hypothetical protein